MLILFTGLLFRTHDLHRIPPGLDGDEMFNAWDAQRVWDGELKVYFPANYGREPIHIYLIALSTRLLGVGAWQIRLPFALCGVIGLALTWALAQRLFGLRVAALATALMAVSLWPVFHYRVALRAGLQPVCQVAAVYALLRAMDEQSRRWAVVGGVFVGLTFYTYTAGRIFPLVLLLWMPILYLLSHRYPAAFSRLPTLRLWTWAALTAALIVLPLGAFALQHPDIFNQRVVALDYEMKQLRAGNLDFLWRSIQRTAGMFFHRGDWEWRYNLPGRPVFDLVSGALFYLGLVVALFRLRKPAYSLLLIWLPVMLIPTVLSIGTPSFMRSLGALTPIYLLPAIGADFILDLLERRPRLSRLAPLIYVGFSVGLILLGADTWRDYFIVWPRSPQVSEIYEADLAAAARYLNDYTPSDTPVWVSSNYPGDLSRVLLDLQSAYPGPVRWFNGNRVTVWPSRRFERDILLIFTQSSPPSSKAAALLTDYSIYQEQNAAGQFHLWVYRIPGDVLSQSPWQPENPVNGRFAWNRELLGYDAPAEIQRGSTVTVTVYWRVPPEVRHDTEDLPYSYVCLQDRAAGRCLGDRSSNYQVYPVWDWSEGDVVAERYKVTAPVYILPQTTHFHVGMYTSVGEISFSSEEQTGVPLLLGPVEVVGSASTDPLWKTDTPVFNEELALIQYRAATGDRSPGSPLPVEIRWQAIHSLVIDYTVRLALQDTAGKSFASLTELLGAEKHPSSRWIDGEPVHTFHTLRIPADIPSGDYEFNLEVMDADGRVVGTPITLGVVSVSGRPRDFDPPEPQHVLTANFGNAIQLVGFDLHNVNITGDGQFEVTLYWQSLDVVSEDYKVFVHLYHPFIEGGLPGQHDGPPGNGAFPTSSWLPGEYITDRHHVPIEPNADPGPSRIGVGLYHSETGARLPVTVDGVPQPNDVLIISEVAIQ